MIQLPLLDDSLSFPPVSTALNEPDGLLAMGGDLSPNRLLAAYQKGIFPWFEESQPILWWSPNPRCVITPESLKISKSLKKSFRNRGYSCTSDQSFNEVITSCSAPRASSSDTWITSEMKRAYLRLHQAGIAHSVEIWSNEQLVGGLYGLCIGPFFFGESMFSQKTDASKIALIYLMKNLQSNGLICIDCQVENTHLMSLGAKLIPREEFCDWLDKHLLTSEASNQMGDTTANESVSTQNDALSLSTSIWPSQWQSNFDLT